MIMREDKTARDVEFMAELEEAVRLRPATPALLMLAAVISLSVIALLWAAISKLEIITRGVGQVVPSQEIQVVQSLEGGILAELLVREGDKIKKGQILMRIKNSQASSDEGSAQAKYHSLAARKARLEAEAKGVPFSMPAEISEKGPQIAAGETALYESRKNELENAYSIIEDRISKATADLAETRAQIGRFAENRRLLQQELEITRKMVEQRAAPKLDQIRLERELADLSGQISAASEKQKGLQSDLEEAKKQKETQAGGFRSQALTELNAVETEIAGLRENLKSMGDRVDRTEVRSPVDGIVNNIALTTIGGVIEPAMRLVEVVPVDDQLKIIARVAPDEVASLKVGQDARVKITAYDPQKFGALNGKLVRIGANSITDKDGNIFFEIEARTEKNYMGPDSAPLLITPGMVAHAEVITGKRSVLEYLLKPILRARDVALTER